MQGVLHQPVEAIKAGRGMMDRMKAPKPVVTMAQEMRERYARIRDHDRKRQLDPNRPVVRPEI